MTREEIIRMAREAGFDAHDMSDDFTCNLKNIERFAALVAAAKREACAKVCEETTAAWTQYLYNEGCIDCAKAIRARGEETHALIKDLRATVHGSPFEHIGEKAQQLGQG